MKRKQHRIVDYDKPLTPDAERLNNYLFQYRDCINRKRILERRHAKIRDEFSPIKSPKLDGMPRAGYSDVIPSAAVLFRLEEIEHEIQFQISEASRLLTELMSVLDLMPTTTQDEILARNILENRYIDRMDKDSICRENHCSYSTQNRYWKKGLYMLLQRGKVQQILEEYERRKAKNAAV